MFSAAVGVGVGGYTWGAPTPPPGSPYSPVPVTQLELLAKNLANLAPAAAGQQALSLQGVGVNVAGSLHHAQHTQHTQHTLNLTGLHHLHHGKGTYLISIRVCCAEKRHKNFRISGISELIYMHKILFPIRERSRIISVLYHVSNIHVIFFILFLVSFYKMLLCNKRGGIQNCIVKN